MRSAFTRAGDGGLIGLWAAIVLLGTGLGSGCTGVPEREAIMRTVYAGADWYEARPEPERMWRGTLRTREAPAGPAARTALLYTLVVDGRQLSIYAANVAQRLAPLAGHKVLVQGKLVDLRDEGFGQELWIGSIAIIEAE